MQQGIYIDGRKLSSIMKLLALDPGYLTGLIYGEWKGNHFKLLEHGFFKEKALFIILERLMVANPPDCVFVEKTRGYPLERKLIRFLEKKKTVLYTVSPFLVHAKLFSRLLSNREREGQEKRLEIVKSYGLDAFFSIHELDAFLLIHFYLTEARDRKKDEDDPMWFYEVLRGDNHL
jgi:hypothetical protein